MVNGGVLVKEGICVFGCREEYPHGFGGLQGGRGAVLDEVDVGDFRVDIFKFGGKVIAGVRQGMRKFGFPKQEEAIRKVSNKDGSFISLTGGREEFQFKFRELCIEFGMVKDFIFDRAGVKGEDNNARVMFRGEKIS